MSAPVLEDQFPGLEPDEVNQAGFVAGAASAFPVEGAVAVGLGGAFLVYREFMRRRLERELKDYQTDDPDELRARAQTLLSTFMPSWVAMAGPLLVRGYFSGMEETAFLMDNAFLEQLAESYAYGLARHINSVSSDALVNGYIQQVNRKIPAKLALANAIDAFGVTNRQINPLVQIWTSKDQEKLSNKLMPSVKKLRAKEFTKRALKERADVIGQQEGWNAKQQGKQVMWLYAMKQGLIPETATRTWITADDERVCPYCGPMHKREQTITEPFEIEGVGKFWSPPVHPRCRCDVKLNARLGQYAVSQAVTSQFGRNWETEFDPEVVPVSTVAKVDDDDWDPREHPRSDRNGRFVRARDRQVRLIGGTEGDRAILRDLDERTERLNTKARAEGRPQDVIPISQPQGGVIPIGQQNSGVTPIQQEQRRVIPITQPADTPPAVVPITQESKPVIPITQPKAEVIPITREDARPSLDDLVEDPSPVEERQEERKLTPEQEAWRKRARETPPIEEVETAEDGAPVGEDEDDREFYNRAMREVDVSDNPMYAVIPKSKGDMNNQAWTSGRDLEFTDSSDRLQTAVDNARDIAIKDWVDEFIDAAGGEPPDGWVKGWAPAHGSDYWVSRSSLNDAFDFVHRRREYQEYLTHTDNIPVALDPNEKVTVYRTGIEGEGEVEIPIRELVRQMHLEDAYDASTPQLARLRRYDKQTSVTHPWYDRNSGDDHNLLETTSEMIVSPSPNPEVFDRSKRPIKAEVYDFEPHFASAEENDGD